MIPGAIRIVYCYAQEDELLRNQLDKHLSALRRLYHIIAWDSNMILAGEEWKSEAARNLARADVILLLISADFIRPLPQ